jgi:WD40 repeat protein
MARKHLVITVHGIQTFGGWQERLESIMSKECDAEGLTFAHYKYGYFSVAAFMIPPLRWLVVRRFRNELVAAVAGFEDARIDLVGHSFGTHIIAWALWGLKQEEKLPVHTLILSGSVLRAGFHWSKLIGSRVGRVINDCGAHDKVLLLNQFFVLFTGMAGRTGFAAMTNDRFRNRYSKFGHGGYFSNPLTGAPDDAYMREHWKPLLLGEGKIPPFAYVPETGPLSGVIMWISNNAEPVKLSVYLGLFFAFTLWVWIQKQTAEDKTEEALQQKQVAELQRDTARLTQSMAVARIADNENAKFHYGNSLALALEFLPNADLGRIRPYAPELERALYRAIAANRETGSLPSSDDLLSYTYSSPDLLVSTTAGGGICLWDVDKKRVRFAFAADGSKKTLQNSAVCSVTAMDPARDLYDGRQKAAADLSDRTRLLAMAADDHSVRVIDTTTGEQQRSIAVGSTINTISFSADGKKLFIAAQGDKFSLIDLKTGTPRQLASKGCSANDGEVNWVADDQLIAFLSAPTSCVWKLTGNENPKIFDTDIEGDFRGSLSDDGRRGIMELPSDRSSTLKIIRPENGSTVKSLKVGSDVEDAVISPSGKKALITRSSGTAELWDIDSSKRRELGRFNEPSILFSTEGELAAVIENDRIAVFKLADGSEIANLSHGSTEIDSAVFDDERHLAVISEKRGNIRLYDVSDQGSLARRFGGHAGITEASFIGTSYILTQDWKGSLRIFDRKTGNVVHSIIGKSDLSSATIHQTGPKIVMTNGNKLTILETSNLHKLVEATAGGDLRGFGADKEGRWFVTTDDKGNIDLWSPGGERKTLRRNAALGVIGDVVVNPAALLFSVAMRDETIGTFTATGESLGPAVKVRGDVVWSADGLSFFVVRKGMIEKDGPDSLTHWDPKTARPIMNSPSVPSMIRAVKPRSSGNIVALGLQNGSIALWNTTSNVVEKTWANGADPVTAVDWSPDGKWLISSDARNTSVRDYVSGELFQAISRPIGASPVDKGNPQRQSGSANPGAAQSMSSLAFSPDLRRVALIDDSGSRVDVVDLASRSLIARFETEPEREKGAQDQPSPSVKFSDDGSWIVSTHIWRSARLWRIWPDTAGIMTAACESLPAILTPLERGDLNLDGRLFDPCKDRGLGRMEAEAPIGKSPTGIRRFVTDLSTYVTGVFHRILLRLKFSASQPSLPN